MDFLYHTIITGVLLAASPFLFLRALFNSQFRQDLVQRISNWKQLDCPPDAIWIHASSVGEVRVAEILIKELKLALPERPVVLSTFTSTGFELASRLKVCPVFRLPPDIPFFLNPMLDRLQPKMLVLIEAELWPGLMRLCNQRGLRALLLNGRMSDRSHQRFLKLQGMFDWMTHAVLLFSMRTETDARRVKDLGINSCRVQVTGNMKFDALYENNGQSPAEKNNRVVFGSTRPGDEEPVIEAIVKLKQEFKDTSYVIAPRHPERVPEVVSLLEQAGLEYTLHSGINGASPSPSLILVDVLGVLPDYYKDASIAFVGGGFNEEHGGQNILEPAGFNVPVLFGKHMQNFEEEAKALTTAGGGVQVESPEQLYPVLKHLLENPEDRIRHGKLAGEAIRNHQGAVVKNVEIINETLKLLEG